MWEMKLTHSLCPWIDEYRWIPVTSERKAVQMHVGISQIAKERICWSVGTNTPTSKLNLIFNAYLIVFINQKLFHTFLIIYCSDVQPADMWEHSSRRYSLVKATWVPQCSLLKHCCTVCLPFPTAVYPEDSVKESSLSSVSASHQNFNFLLERVFLCMLTNVCFDRFLYIVFSASFGSLTTQWRVLNGLLMLPSSYIIPNIPGTLK